MQNEKLIIAKDLLNLEIDDFLKLDKLSKEQTEILMNNWWKCKISKFFTRYDFKSPTDQTIINKFYNKFDYESLLLLEKNPDINVEKITYSLQNITFFTFFFFLIGILQVTLMIMFLNLKRSLISEIL